MFGHVRAPSSSRYSQHTSLPTRDFYGSISPARPPPPTPPPRPLLKHSNAHPPLPHFPSKTWGVRQAPPPRVTWPGPVHSRNDPRTRPNVTAKTHRTGAAARNADGGRSREGPISPSRTGYLFPLLFPLLHHQRLWFSSPTPGRAGPKHLHLSMEATKTIRPNLIRQKGPFCPDPADKAIWG